MNESRYSQALSQAAQALGGRQRLAEFLDVPPERLEVWLRGKEVPPQDVFLAALDVIAP